MKTVCNLGVLALATTGAMQALADTPETANRLEEIVVTSSRVPMPLRQVGTSVSVITASEIEQLGYNALYDVLRTQPGVGVSNQAGPGSVTSLRIRGEENYRTRFYLDGIDISDSSSPQTTTRVEHLLSTGVERVEILRGPQGMMYGADAGGVVNITTATSNEGLSGELSAEGGRYDTQQYAGTLSGGNDTVDFSLSGTDYATDLFNARTTDTDLRDDDGYENTTLHGRFGWNATEAVRVSLVARDVDADNEYDDCFTVDTFAPSNACSDSFEQRSWRGAVAHAGEFLQHELFYTTTGTNRDFFTEGQFAFKLDGEVERTGYLGSFEGGEALRLVYGVDLLNESIDDGFTDNDRGQNGYFAEYQGGFANRFFVTAGARYDDNDDFGSHTSWRASGAYLIPIERGEIKLRGTYGTGFRAPSLFEIATNESPFTSPPAQGFELAEENSEGYDLAVSWAHDNGAYVELVYFDQKITNEILFDFNSSGYLQETGDTESSGVEAGGEWPLAPGLSMSGNYTYTDSRNIDGDPRPRRPEHMANAGITWTTLANRLVLGLHARLSHDAVDVDGTALDDYEVLSINASYSVVDGLELYGRVENLTDEDYEEVPTFNTSGAAGYLGLRYSF